MYRTEKPVQPVSETQVTWGARGVWSWGQSGSTLAKRTTAMKAKGVLVVSSDHQDWKNKLYFGDNLNVLREHVQDETADLLYLDPPFNSNATYNVLFREKGGEQSAAQIELISKAVLYCVSKSGRRRQRFEDPGYGMC